MKIPKDADFDALSDMIRDGQSGIYYSQMGEDVILWKLFRRKRDGFYVDIGAHAPIRFSNTYLLHRFAGWSGINIDADHRAIVAFDAERPNDANVLAAISDEAGIELKMTVYSDGAVNTFDDGMRARRARRKSAIAEERILTTRTLASVLDEHLPPGKHIDFFDLDIEGLEMQALRSNDWTRYRPDYILAEMHNFTPMQIGTNPVSRYLMDQGYEMTSYLYATGLFKRI